MPPRESSQRADPAPPPHADWIWNFLLSFFAPRIAEKIGPLILLIFFGMLVFGYVYVYFFIPETKGRSLEEMDVIFGAVDADKRMADIARQERGESLRLFV